MVHVGGVWGFPECQTGHTWRLPGNYVTLHELVEQAWVLMGWQGKDGPDGAEHIMGSIEGK